MNILVPTLPEIKLQTIALKKVHIEQFDFASDNNITKKDKPICRIHWQDRDWILFQTDTQVVKISVSTYLNCGWNRTFGEYETIPKVIL